MKKLYLAGLGVLVPGIAMAEDVAFTITAPTFDWSVLGTIATAILLASVGMAIFNRSKRVIR